MLFSCFLLLCCCDKLIVFETPQPEKQRDEAAVPRRMTGRYRSLSDSSVLFVTSQDMLRMVNLTKGFRLTELDSADRISLKGDTIFTEKNGEEYVTIEVTGDSVYYTGRHTDTLFSVSRGDKLRKLKGYYLINKKTEDGSWIVSKLGRIKAGLVLGTISTKDDLDKLRALTEQGEDSVYNFRPTRRDMKKFMRDGGFANEEVFVKF